MKYYQHDFENVADYLHHRPPYLLVEKVVSVSDSQIVTEKTVSENDFYIPGHFPGAPIMPGAMMQELTTQSAGVLIAARYNPMETFNTTDPFANEFALGVLVKIKKARYRTFARPGQTLAVTVSLTEKLDSLFDFDAKIVVDGQTVMQNSFQLMNIESKVLQGV
jgi:3-hydroxyacyl-[acyl-carrier-protein] dehydratase